MRENEILVFLVRLILLHMIISTFINFPTDDIILFLFITEKLSIVCVFTYIFLYPFILLWVLRLVLWLVTIVTVNWAYSYPCCMLTNSFEFMSKSGIAGSQGSSVFSFLRSFYTDFHCGWTNLISTMKGPYFCPHPTHPCQHLLLVISLMVTILTGIKWNLNEVLICIS
jgi:hypothetical protein